jgi:hypothetical protein
MEKKRQIILSRVQLKHSILSICVNLVVLLPSRSSSQLCFCPSCPVQLKQARLGVTNITQCKNQIHMHELSVHTRIYDEFPNESGVARIH